MREMPDLPKMVLKKGVMKAVERGIIKQTKGKGFSGSFKVYFVIASDKHLTQHVPA